MPNIRTFDAPQGLGLNPTETGIEATAQAGNRIGRFFNQAASATQEVGNEAARGFSSAIKDAGDVAVQYEDHQQISAGAAHGAELFSNLNQSKDDAIKSIDPNDPAYGQKVEIAVKKWREETLEPSLQKFSDGFTTENSQKWAEHFIDGTRQHMFNSSAADVSTAAGIGIRNAFHTTVNVATNTAVNDPSSVPAQLDLLSHSVDGLVSSSPVRGVDAVKLKTELADHAASEVVKAGAIGAIQKAADPEAEAEKWGQKYPQYINGSGLKMLAGNARQQIRAARSDETNARVLQDRAVKQQSDTTEVSYLQKLYSDDPKTQGQVSTKAIVNDPNLTRESKERMIGVVNREFKPETDAKISAQSSTALFRMISDPNADPDKARAAIIAARGKDPGEAGSINKSDFTDLMKNLEDVKTPQGAALAQDRTEFFKRYSASIDPTISSTTSMNAGHFSALGSQRAYQAEKDARRQEDLLKSKGQDPHSLYDPSSPNFFGKNLSKYSVSMQDAAAYQSSLESGAGKASMNLTGPGTTVTGIDVKDAPVSPKVGEVRQGYRFKGGDPATPASWEKAQ